jgi:hypothetical protein
VDGTYIPFGSAEQKVYAEKFKAYIVDVKLSNGSTRKELKSSLFVQNARNKPEEAVKQLSSEAVKEEIIDTFEELNYKIKINCLLSGYIKTSPYLPELSKKAIELTARCLSMDSEKCVTIDEAIFR